MSNRAVVLTISDRCHRGEAADRSGPAIIELLPNLDATLVHRQTLPDDLQQISSAITLWLGRAEIILTTGGTGIAARDATADAIEPLLEKHLPGFGEIMRSRAFDETPLSIISRCGAGIAGGSLIIWLPGSPQAVRSCIEYVTPAIRHVCDFLRGRTPH